MSKLFIICLFIFLPWIAWADIPDLPGLPEESEILIYETPNYLCYSQRNFYEPWLGGRVAEDVDACNMQLYVYKDGLIFLIVEQHKWSVETQEKERRVWFFGSDPVRLEYFRDRVVDLKRVVEEGEILRGDAARKFWKQAECFVERLYVGDPRVVRPSI